MQPSQSQYFVQAPPLRDPRLQVQVCCFSHEDRHVIIPRLSIALAESGCWLMGCRVLRPSDVEYRLDMSLRSALDLYGGLVNAGLELTEGSHRGLTNLCTLRKHHRLGPGANRLVDLRLEVRFLDAPRAIDEQAPGPRLG
jgi:hypothetical protein